MCRHIYNWNIVACNVKQPISLIHTLIGAYWRLSGWCDVTGLANAFISTHGGLGIYTLISRWYVHENSHIENTNYTIPTNIDISCRKRRLNGADSRNNRIQRVAPCRCFDGHIQEKKKEIWPSPMTKPPIPTENSKTKGQHTQRHQKLRLHNDCGPT